MILDSKAETPVGRLEKATLNTSDDSLTVRRSTVVYAHADEWLYPSYYRYCEQVGSKAVANRRFTALLTDLLLHQLKLTTVEYLPKTGNSLSRFKGICVRTDTDTPWGGVFSNTKDSKDSKDSKRQQKDSKKDSNGKEKTANLAENIFAAENNNIVDLGNNESKNAEQDRKNVSQSEFASTFAVNTEESNSYSKFCCHFAVTLPDFAVQQDSKQQNSIDNLDFGDDSPPVQAVSFTEPTSPPAQPSPQVKPEQPSTWNGPCYKCAHVFEIETGGLWCNVVNQQLPKGATSVVIGCQSYQPRGNAAITRIDSVPVAATEVRS